MQFIYMNYELIFGNPGAFADRQHLILQLVNIALGRHALSKKYRRLEALG